MSLQNRFRIITPAVRDYSLIYTLLTIAMVKVFTRLCISEFLGGQVITQKTEQIVKISKLKLHKTFSENCSTNLK